MPGIFKGNATPGQPTPFQNFAITAAPMFSAMAAGYASGRGPYAYMDQGLAAMEKRQKDKRDAEAAAAASAAFKALMRPGGNGVARGGYSPSGTWSPAPPPPSPVDVATQGMDVARSGGLSFGDRQKAESGMIGGGQEKLGFGSAVMSPQEMLIAGAEARGLNPIDVATAISYETGGRFDPMIAGPTTQWGTHRGLIQFGEPQAKQHGVDFSNPDAAWRSQLDPTSGAVWKYLDGAGVRPGMGLPEVYSAINAGSVGRMNASDANNGGAPGTVADKVAGMGPHREKAAQFLGGTWTPNDNVTMSAKDGGGFVPGYAGGPVDPMADPYVQQLMTVMSMPGLSPEQQAVAQTMLQSRIQLITTPQPGAEEEQERARRARDAEMLGLQPGTPQFNQYVVTGQMPEAPKPIEVGGVLLDPQTMQPIFDSREGGKPPTSVAEYEYYKQGAELRGLTPMSYEEFLVADEKASVPPGAPQIGTIPPGYQAVQDPTTQAWTFIPIPGGPEDTSQKDAKKEGNAATASAVVTTAAERALAAAQERAMGGFGQGLVANMPWTDSAEVARQVEVLKANAKVDNLQAMRDASPTGGALGSVTEGETAMLAAKSGALDPSSPNFERDLADYTRTLLRVVHGPEVGDRIFAETWKGAMPDGAVPSGGDLGLTEDDLKYLGQP